MHIDMILVLSVVVLAAHTAITLVFVRYWCMNVDD